MPTMEDILLAPPEPGVILDLDAIFGPGRCIELEIGTGKGAFLLSRARAHPDRGFLGVEWANKYCRYAADRMARWGVTNVRLMRTDAANLVCHHLPPGRLAMIHIYHPDPWPKKRHHRRRLIQAPFVAAAVRALVPGGRIAIQTDHAEYFEHIRAVVQAEPALAEVPFDVPEAGVIDGRVQTNFEIKYLREGRTLYQLAVARTPRSG
ncbi:MAG: tRNA (guanosine(46)-N7)-methyltransferase TrmB [Phycisphaerae bacterium]|jgi:tRNA (guanine-N7-)-methyltransferase